MIKCLLIDDEPYARELLSEHIAAFDDVSIIAACKDVKEAAGVLQKHNVDLIFLDVNMPEISGMDFLKSTTNIPSVILTTAYRDYAIDAYEYGVIDYLVKPISFLRFAKAVDRYRKSYHVDRDVSIIIKSGGEMYKILPGQIEYIESSKEYITIICREQQFLIRSSMNNILQQLPPGSFLQIHRSYIIPVSKVIKVTASEVILNRNISLPIGRSFSKDVRNYFKQKL